ncbi:MAG: flagellar basal body P-ring protein FlgI [Phycisphaerales bacterium]|nr:MAG: flagellar basal body P-ring protein FlgI [Phycisphaerales bacterium]
MSVDRKTAGVMVILLAVCLSGGCGERGGARGSTKALAPRVDLGRTIGSLGKVTGPVAMPVEGLGLVGGLRGTGSAECPPAVRAYLARYIATQVTEGKVDVDELITSLDTAVVFVQGTVPAGSWQNQTFDVRVTPVPGTQTTSLEGGWLYTAELKLRGAFGATTRALANAQGPVFTDKISATGADPKLGYVLAGAKVLDEHMVVIMLGGSDYMVASNIRNRLNERYGHGTARAISSSQIEVRVPAKYRPRKERFVSMLEATYLEHTPGLAEARIRTFVGKLAAPGDRYASEVALEAIGNAGLSKLGILLNSSDEEVRLRAARCMLNLGSDRGLQSLREVAMDARSAHRVAALEALTASANRSDAAAVCRRLLSDNDFNIRLVVLEQLRRLDDVSVTQRLVAGSFYLDQIAQADRKVVFVSRSGQPRIVLFGAPLYCRDNVFVQSADGNIVMDSRAGQKYVSLMRRHPTRPVMIGPLKCSFRLSDIIQVLCEEPLRQGKPRGGLGVSYSDMIALVKQMCDKGVVRAEFRAGPMPKIGLNVKK